MTELSSKRLEYDVPARMGKAFRVSKGELIKVIDVKGGQAADFFAFNVDKRLGNTGLRPGPQVERPG